MRRGRAGRALLHAGGALLLLLLLWPLVYAVWMSFSPDELLEPPTGAWSLRWYRQLLDSPLWMDALATSLRIAAWATALSVLAGGGVSLALARARFRGAGLLQLATALPLFVPAVVLGMGLLPFVRAVGLWGSDLSIAGAHALWGLPVVVLVVRAALEEVDPDLERAARGLGASPWQAFRRVTLPLVLPAVAAGALMAAVLSLNEFVMALFLGTPETETLPRVIWPQLRYTLSPVVAAASGVSMLLTLLALLVAASVGRLEAVVRWLGGRARRR
jgi:ABC-type spermidine/putrescine transport system permease subunit II